MARQRRDDLDPAVMKGIEHGAALVERVPGPVVITWRGHKPRRIDNRVINRELGMLYGRTGDFVYNIALEDVLSAEPA